MDLPDEIWIYIFDLAADEDIIFQYGLPTTMGEYAWYRDVNEDWQLRSPSDALIMIQKKSYGTKKAILNTCKKWYHLVSESLFRCLFFDDIDDLLSLKEILQHSSTESTVHPGWWTRRFHLSRPFVGASEGTNLPVLQAALIAILRRCPNLEVVIIDWPLDDYFGPVADALIDCAQASLRTVHWNVSCEALPKVIWALDLLPNILAAHIEFETPVPELKECVSLGSAEGIRLDLKGLQQLSLSGYCADFLEQATGWELPALKVLSINPGLDMSEHPDIVAFLTHHGTDLLLLDINCIPALDVPKMLDLCPSLRTFAFNADWRLAPLSDSENELVHRAHTNITAVGLHGLQCAFGVGRAREYTSRDPVASYLVQRSNDLNAGALTKQNFPNLKIVRSLSSELLMELNEEGRPGDEGGGMDRWESWWDRFTRAGIRLEDCTGASLGTLPDGGGDGESEDDEDDDDDEYESEGEWYSIPPMEEQGGERTSELRQLLEECRAMEAGREESIFGPMNYTWFT